MKIKLTLLLFIVCAFNAFSQAFFFRSDSLVLQPDSCTGKNSRISSCVPCGYDNLNAGQTDELSAEAWTNGGNISNGRGLLAFDLSSIPVSTTITSATLSLFWNPDPASGNAGQSTLSGPNDGWLQRITSPWGVYTVTWDNQPATTTQNEVDIPASTSDSESYPNIDVTALVQDMVNNPSQSFGFMLRLQNETYYRALMFASSYHANPALHPKLVVTFAAPDTSVCLYMQPDIGMCSNSKDAVIGSCVPCGYDNSNYGSSDELGAIAWTNGGNVSNERGLLQFDLSTIPPNATVSSADLSLFWNPDPASGNPGQSTLSGPNDGWLQRITSNWDEYTVTWDNQPPTTTQNEVAIPASTSDTESYPNIDVTALVQDMVSNPSQSFGFMIRQQNETYYRALIFASRNHPNAALHPILQVCYTTASVSPPIASFESGDSTLCGSGCINFTDLSTNATSWQWSFNGANPSSSTTQNPQNVCYSSAGNYDVSLIASNAGGSDTIAISNFITVNSAPPTPTITESNDTLFCSTDTSYAYYQWYYDNGLIPGETNPYLVISFPGNYNLTVTNKTGCTIAVGISVITDVQNYSSNNSISILPNPATNQLTIRTSSTDRQKATLSIMNVLGQETSPPTSLFMERGSAMIDVSNLPSGIYFVQVVGEKERWVGKFVKSSGTN